MMIRNRNRARHKTKTRRSKKWNHVKGTLCDTRPGRRYGRVREKEFSTPTYTVGLTDNPPHPVDPNPLEIQPLHPGDTLPLYFNDDDADVIEQHVDEDVDELPDDDFFDDGGVSKALKVWEEEEREHFLEDTRLSLHLGISYYFIHTLDSPDRREWRGRAGTIWHICQVFTFEDVNEKL